MASNTKYKSDYFLKDYATIREELISRIPIVSDGKLTDLNESSISVTLVELFAAIADMLGMYLDSSALEAFLPTVRQPENVYRHADLIGYTIREITSARAEVQFSIPQANTGSGMEIFIPKGTRLGTATGNAGQFITRENTTIPLGQTVSEKILAIQGVSQTESFASDGTSGQFVTLESSSIDPSTIEVYTGDTKWSPVESFLYSQNDDFHYVVKTSFLGVTRVYFGDGKFGRVPNVGEIITVNYLVSEGEDGNVGAGSIGLIISDIQTLSGIQVENVTVTNPDPAAGGSNRQSLESVKKNAPGALSALYRPLTKYDYVALISRLGGVLHVNVWGEQEEDPPSYENFNWVNIVLVPEGGGLPSQNLKSTVESYLLEIQPITVRLRFIDPEYVYLVPNVAIYTSKGYSQEDIRIQVKDAIREYFDLENVRFGQDIRAAYLYKMIMDIDGIDYVFISNFQQREDDESLTDVGQEVVLQKWEVPVLDSINITTSTATELPVPDLYPDEEI